MTAEAKLNVGIVGACARGGNFKAGCDAVGVRVAAVCDINKAGLPDAAKRLGADEQYDSYEKMLDKAKLDAVIIGTPMHLHVPQSVAALERNLHVLCEVTAGVSIEECRTLVDACRKSKGVYMMAENYTYTRPNILIRELARKGLFGRRYYAEGEYLHELKKMNEDTPWRRKWQTGVPGVTYCTHSLGPILQWLDNDRVVKVCCTDVESPFADPRGEKYANTTPVMLCKTAGGATVKIRLDMISDRPHAMNNYQLQGVDGCYESGRGHGDPGMIWLRKFSAEPRWVSLDDIFNIGELADQYVPEFLRNPPPEALRAGHGGGDYFEILDFVNACTGKAPCSIGIHEAMDMTLPGLVSQQSAAQGGTWLDVPDSRQWGQPANSGQLHMIWPRRLLNSPPKSVLPDGYILRTYRPGDADQWAGLMNKVGFNNWNPQFAADMASKTLEDGVFFIEHKPSAKIVATSMAWSRPTQVHPNGGELGWVACDPEHNGKGLGMAVCNAVVAKFIAAGFKEIYLMTDDFRLPAIKTYLKMGFEPCYHAPDMKARWQDVLSKLNWKA